MKKMLCVLLALLLCPVMVMAEESAADMLSRQELIAWAEDYIARARQAQPLNNPADSLTEDGYKYIYNFATLYADTPEMSADTIVSAVVLTAEEENGPRNVNVNTSLSVVLDAYYSENTQLQGSREGAVIYAVDMMPTTARWAQVLRDGQRVKTVQYAVHDQLSVGDLGYSDAGVIYTMEDNRVSAIRVYGLNSRISRQQVNDVMYALMFSALERNYVQVPFSYDGEELAMFGAEDVILSGVNFLTLTPESAVTLLGEPVSDDWMENGKNSDIRVQRFENCELTYLFNKAHTEGQVYMLHITGGNMEGPRAVRCGDSFASVYNRFRNGEGEMEGFERETLYGEDAKGNYGRASYGTDASATLRYGFTAEDGRKVELQMNFTLMELAEILLYAK